MQGRDPSSVTRPVRIRLRRSRGWRKPENTVVVARPSRYGNPHRIGWCPACGAQHSREEAVAAFRADVRNERLRAAIRAELGGKNLACWCPEDAPCHADVLLEIANG